MGAKRIFVGLLLVLLVCGGLIGRFVWLSTQAAVVSGKIRLKGNLTPGHLWLMYYGAAKNGDLDWGEALGDTGEDVGAPVPGETPSLKLRGRVVVGRASATSLVDGKPIELDGKGKDWTYSVRGLHPGYHLLRAVFMRKGREFAPASFGVTDGQTPTCWEWIQVRGQRDRLTVDLEVNLDPDPKDAGAIEVSSAGRSPLLGVGIAPIDNLDLSSPAARVVARRKSVLGYMDAIWPERGIGRTLTVKGLRPGDYRVFNDNSMDSTAPAQVDVNVRGGETVKARLAEVDSEK